MGYKFKNMQNPKNNFINEIIQVNLPSNNFYIMERQGQSKLEIASLLISMITAMGLFIFTLIAGVIESNSYRGMKE